MDLLHELLYAIEEWESKMDGARPERPMWDYQDLPNPVSLARVLVRVLARVPVRVPVRETPPHRALRNAACDSDDVGAYVHLQHA